MQALAQLCRCSVHAARSREYDDIDRRKLVLRESKQLAHDALETVAIDCAARVFA